MPKSSSCDVNLPVIIEPHLYATGYPADHIEIDALGNLLMLYAVPVLIAAIVTKIALAWIKHKPSHNWSEILVFLVPFLIWIATIYGDSSAKGAKNLYELVWLGALVGVVLGINRRLTNAWINGVTCAWFLGVVALGLWMFVPSIPPKWPTF